MKIQPSFWQVERAEFVAIFRRLLGMDFHFQSFGLNSVEIWCEKWSLRGDTILGRGMAFVQENKSKKSVVKWCWNLSQKTRAKVKKKTLEEGNSSRNFRVNKHLQLSCHQHSMFMFFCPLKQHKQKTKLFQLFKMSTNPDISKRPSLRFVGCCYALFYIEYGDLPTP